MEKIHTELLITNRTKLVKNIDVTKDLYSELLQRKVLNQRMVRNIKTNKNTDTQIEELLDILPRRGPDAFHLFCESLIATGQQTIVHSILKVNLAEEPTKQTAASCTVSTAHSEPYGSSMATDTPFLTAITSSSIESATSTALQLKNEEKVSVESAGDLASETETPDGAGPISLLLSSHVFCLCCSSCCE